MKNSSVLSLLLSVFVLTAPAQHLSAAPKKPSSHASKPGAPVPLDFQRALISPNPDTPTTPPANEPVLRKTYNLWLTDYFTPGVLADPTQEATVWGRNADPDGDGTRNQLEYFIGTSPTVGSAPPALNLSFVVVSGQTYPVLSFPRRKLSSDPNMLVEIQTADNPSAPFVTVPAEFLSATTPADPANLIEIATYRLLTPVSPQGRLFARLQLTPYLVDTDGDGLAGAIENGSHVYNGPGNPGTDANSADTDGDSLRDGDETLGTLAGLNLPQMGCSPLHRNLLLEYHWFDDALECAAHSHRPTQTALDRVTTAFAGASGVNPDGTTGIAMIHDRGDGGIFNAGSLVSNQDSAANMPGGVNGAQFQVYKNASFPANRNGYFHYVLLPHRYNTNSTSSGQAEINGDDLVVSLYCFGSDGNVANTIMHELGHNLNLRHGGNVDCNYKANYNSVMNYRYQFPGVNTNCAIPGSGLLDYSRGVRIALNENALNENLGVCGNVPVDFNGNSVIESNVVFDLNSDDTTQASTCGGTLTTLTDYNDWGNVSFAGLSDGDGANLFPLEVIDCDNPPPR